MKLKALEQLRSTMADVGTPTNAPVNRPTTDSTRQRAGAEHLPSPRAPGKGLMSQRPRGAVATLAANLASLSRLHPRSGSAGAEAATPSTPSTSVAAPELPGLRFEPFRVDFARPVELAAVGGNAHKSEQPGESSPNFLQRMDSSATTLVASPTDDGPAAAGGLSHASTAVASPDAQRATTATSPPKSQVRQVQAQALDEAAVLKRLGRRHAETGRQLLSDIHDIAASVRDRAEVPNLSEFEAQAKLEGSVGLGRALSCLNTFRNDMDAELRGVDSFAHTRLNVALKTRPKLAGLFSGGDSNLLKTLQEARDVVHDRGRVDADTAGRPKGELLRSRAKAFENSLMLGFDAETKAIDDPAHALWRLAGALGVSLDPDRLRARNA